jgi:hypothetical protein
MSRMFKKRLMLMICPNLLVSRKQILLLGNARSFVQILAPFTIILTLGVSVTQTISMNVVRNNSIEIKAKRMMTPRNQPRLALISLQSTHPRTKWTLHHPQMDLFSMMRT